MAGKRIFISYSRSDSELVKPLAQLLKLGGRSVFLDIDNIEPGKRWKDAIGRGIQKADYFVLLWCCHSAQSEQVAEEIRAAIGTAKSFLPILLCPIDVPSPIDQYQWVDLRFNFVHSCNDHSEVKALPKQTIPAKQVLYMGTQLSSFEPVEIARAWKGATNRSLQRGLRASGIAMTLGLTLLAIAAVRPFPSPFGSEGSQVVNILAATIGGLATIASWSRILKAQRQGMSLLHADRQSQLLGLTINCLIKVVEKGGKFVETYR
jgi:hypothetical protein